MDTVQLPCNHCGRLMAVSVEHMGMQVHCPHCQGVVQVPAAEVMSDKTWLDKPDAFPEKAAEPPSPARQEAPITISSNELTAADLLRDAPLRSKAGKETPHEPAWMKESDDDNDSDELPLAPHIQRQRASMLVPILLLFLIPYSLAMTGWVAYLIYRSYQNRVNAFDPLERLPDPRPGDGGPQQVREGQVKHDLKLAAKLKTHLQQPIQIGDLEVTPTRVQWSAKGDLVLVMKMKNVSRDVEFCPMLDDFCAFAFKDTGLRPYTYVQSFAPEAIERPSGGDRLYGGTLKVIENGKETRIDPSRRLRPEQEMTIRLTTRSQDLDRAKWIKKNPQDLLWRVQVRRGLMPTREGPRSATAVIGVQFNSSAIEG